MTQVYNFLTPESQSKSCISQYLFNCGTEDVSSSRSHFYFTRPCEWWCSFSFRMILEENSFVALYFFANSWNPISTSQPPNLRLIVELCFYYLHYHKAICTLRCVSPLLTVTKWRQYCKCIHFYWQTCMEWKTGGYVVTSRWGGIIVIGHSSRNILSSNGPFCIFIIPFSRPCVWSAQ